ncbi:MAG: NUDIX domain-containing protein [Candidatus Paceibacterota bacterium]|jgi:ADP-ribose pyrophosphatase YjhB (NUDIX family)
MQEIHSAGGVVIGPKGEVLLVCQDGACWSLPKGPLEKSESAMDAAQRKIYEESGIEPEDLNYIKPLGTYQRYRTGSDGKEDVNTHKTIDMFLFRTQVDDLDPREPDISEARWFPKYEVIKYLTHPKDKEFFTSVLFDLP